MSEAFYRRHGGSYFRGCLHASVLERLSSPRVEATRRTRCEGAYSRGCLRPTREGPRLISSETRILSSLSTSRPSRVTAIGSSSSSIVLRQR